MKLCSAKAQAIAHEYEPMDFIFDSNDLPPNNSLPAIELHLQVPKLPGQDTLHFNMLSWKAQSNRKVFHVECDSHYVKDIKKLAQIAKEANIVKDIWGKHANISKVVDKDSIPSKIRRLLRVAQVHTNYQCLMILENLVGITDLNGLAELFQPSTSTPLQLTLWMVLLHFVQMGDGHPLFAEVHQSNEVMGRVQAVIPNTPEAKQMVIMMNKILPAYVGFSLRYQGLQECSCWNCSNGPAAQLWLQKLIPTRGTWTQEFLLLSASPTKINIQRSWKRQHGLRTLLRISDWYQKVATSILPLHRRLYLI